MLNGELTPRRRLNGDLTGGVFYGTNDYNELINKPSVNGTVMEGDITIDIPTKTSDLTNDSGFITDSDLSPVAISGDYDDLTNKPTIPTATSELTNDSGFITSADIPTKTSDLINDSGFITTSDIPTDVSYFANDAGYLTENTVSPVAISGDYDDLINKPTIPTATSELDNDSGFITSADIPSNLSDFNNDCGFIGFTDLTGTLTTGNTTLTITDDTIETTSTIDIYCDLFGVQPTNAVVTTHQLVLTFLAQASDITVKVRVS